jgi:hypothetical protein
VARPRAYEDGWYGWHLGRVPATVDVDGVATPHPAHVSAVFVVHGIGEQKWTATAAGLSAGFDDALQAIGAWQRKNEVQGLLTGPVPPPLISEGYWADYSSVEATFPRDWGVFDDRERRFFGGLWAIRTLSASRAVLWVLGQQLRLLSPRVLFTSPLAWLLYLPLQLVAPVLLLVALVRWRRLLTGYVTDFRLYLDPRGDVEGAIAQRIDHRVGETFLRTIGLGWDFRALPEAERLRAAGKPVAFERVIWVSHSLGTVISYNVLSDLFARAEELAAGGDAAQKEGVARFRKGLRRFVTLGSPLDKVAWLFGTGALRPWPKGSRETLLEGGDQREGEGDPGPREWWINFYHVLDPVSGALSHPLVCGERPPANLHVRSGWVPGLAHVKYWTDVTALRFVLGRAYGKQWLPDRPMTSWPAPVLTALSFVGYLAWGAILYGAVYAILRWGPRLVWDALTAVGRWLWR